MNHIGKIYKFSEPIFINSIMQANDKETLKYGDKEFIKSRPYNTVSDSMAEHPQCFKGTLKGIVKENNIIFVIMDLFGADNFVWKGTRLLLKIPMNNYKLISCESY